MTNKFSGRNWQLSPLSKLTQISGILTTKTTTEQIFIYRVKWHHKSIITIQSSFCGHNILWHNIVDLSGKDLSCYLNKSNDSLRKSPYDHVLTNEVLL